MPNLGMPELMIILVIALIVFGPRKLPELGKSLGKAMGQFKRASEDFKRTWEQEVELEKTRSSIADTGSTASTNHDASHHSYDGSYDPYNSDYSHDTSSETAATPTPAPAPAVAEATAAPKATSNKPQPGQWI